MPPRLAFHLLLALLLWGCGRNPPRAVRGTPEVSTYEAGGVLRKIDAQRGKAVVAHDAIAGYMEAMTMEFDVADGESLAVLQPGDAVAFRLSVTEARSWIDRLRKTGHTGIAAVPTTPAGSLPPGALLPDCALVDQRGAAFRLSDFKGRAIAFTFIFTRCPLPDFCPLMNRNLAEVQRELSGYSSRSNWHLLSISFDPEYDTPARLAEYARPFNIDTGHWTFATGETEDIRRLAAAFGLTVARNGEQVDHTLRTVVVDAAGRVQKVFAGNEWKSADLIGEMQRAVAVEP